MMICFFLFFDAISLMLRFISLGLIALLCRELIFHSLNVTAKALLFRGLLFHGFLLAAYEAAAIQASRFPARRVA